MLLLLLLSMGLYTLGAWIGASFKELPRRLCEINWTVRIVNKALNGSLSSLVCMNEAAFCTVCVGPMSECLIGL